jgi:Rieske 2Fe-2S protein
MSEESLPVEGLQALAPGRWRGRVRFPNRIQATAILIFALDRAWAGVRAHCPHEGYDLSDCALVEGCTLVCPRHGLALSLKGRAAFRVTRQGGAFAVGWPLQC